MQRRSGRLAATFGFASLMAIVTVIPTETVQGRTPRASIAPGIYSSVTMSPDTGDLDGLEVEIGKAGQIETVFCEGWCNATDRTTYVRRGGSIAYDLHMQTLHPDGRITIDALTIALKPSGRNVLARMAGDTGWQVLKRQPRPFGLAVARDEQAAAKARR